MNKLYAIVSKDTGRIMTNGNGRLGIFIKEGMVRRHAWRYGAKKDNFVIIPYTADKTLQDIIFEEFEHEANMEQH